MNTLHPTTTNHRPGYVSILGVLSIGIVLLLILTATYRYAVQSQNIQKRNQLYIDYAYREQACLRAVLTLAPNAAMKAMMTDSSDGGAIQDESSWLHVFSEALTLADSETAISDAEIASLGIPTTSISGNIADGDYGHPNTIFSPISGLLSSGFAITPGINDIELTLGVNDFPESLTVVNASSSNSDDEYPIITTEKYYDTPGTNFKVMDYPNVHFGYSEQGQTFVAKRNWWAFTVNMGNEAAASTGFKPAPKNYVLSIYEVPSQLALGSTALTNLGQHDDGTDWRNVVITGGAYARKAETMGSLSLTRLSSMQGVTLTDTSSVGGIGAGTHPSRETFEATGTDFFPLTTSADSGLVSFIPINLGDDAYDNISNIQDSDYSSSADARLSPTSWSWYSRPAVQCVMKLKVLDVVGLNNQKPITLSFSYLSGGIENTVTYSRTDASWPASNTVAGGIFPFHTENTPDGRVGLTVHLDRLQAHLTALGADNSAINHSLAVSADYLSNLNVTKPNIPSLPADTAIIMRGTEDFTGFDSGFSIVSAFRLYLAEDVNIIPKTLGGTDYPAISFFAPEKRFGLRRAPMLIDFDGQINHLTKSTAAVNPLDLRSGTTESVVPENITANLFSISDTSQLPPVNQMNWLVVIEEVH